MSPSEKYIHALKNPSKKAYAQAYAKHIRQGGPEPERPKNLSYMGAQAVRMSLYELTSPKHETESGDAYLERFSRPAGGKRRKTIATKGKWTRNPSNVITLRKTGTDPWFIWRDVSALLRIAIQRVDFSDLGYAWEIVAPEGRISHGTTSFHAALENINSVLERNGYHWRVTAKAPSAGGKKRHSTAYNHAVTGTLRRPEVIAAAKELRAINRKLPKMGWGVRMPDGRELLHDRNGYYYVGEADGGKGGGKKRHGSSSLPVEGDECPVCQSGTVVLEEGELRCAGECGKIWKLPRGSKKRGVGAQVAELNKLLK